MRALLLSLSAANSAVAVSEELQPLQSVCRERLSLTLAATASAAMRRYIDGFVSRSSTLVLKPCVCLCTCVYRRRVPLFAQLPLTPSLAQLAASAALAFHRAQTGFEQLIMKMMVMMVSCLACQECGCSHSECDYSLA